MGEGDHTGWAGQDVAWSVRPDGEGEGEGGCPWVQRRHDLGWGTARAGVWVGGCSRAQWGKGGLTRAAPRGRQGRAQSVKIRELIRLRVKPHCCRGPVCQLSSLREPASRSPCTPSTQETRHLTLPCTNPHTHTLTPSVEPQSPPSTCGAIGAGLGR